MKRKYLIKKDPAKEGQDNWIIMNSEQFLEWKKTPEGQLRYYNLGRLDACDEDDYIIYMECDEETRTQWKKESDKQRYTRECMKKANIEVLSYHAMTFGDEEMNGEETLWDQSTDIESEVIRTMEYEALHHALESLNERDREIIEAYFLCDNPLTEKELSAVWGIPQTTLRSRKKAALARLRKILEKKFVQI